MRAASLLLLALLLAGCTAPADLGGAGKNNTGGSTGGTTGGSGGGTTGATTALEPIEGCAAHQTSESTAVVGSDTEWRTFWTKYCGTANGGPPAVDFTRFSVVAAFEGQRNTAGHTVRLTNITDTGVGQTIEEVRTQPDPNCALAQVVTYPFAIAKGPRVTKPPTFHVTTTQTPC